MINCKINWHFSIFASAPNGGLIFYCDSKIYQLNCRAIGSGVRWRDFRKQWKYISYRNQLNNISFTSHALHLNSNSPLGSINFLIKTLVHKRDTNDFVSLFARFARRKSCTDNLFLTVANFPFAGKDRERRLCCAVSESSSIENCLSE